MGVEELGDELPYSVGVVFLGAGSLPRDAELGRQALYRSLSQEGNPELDTLTRVLRELGLRLAVESAA